MLHGLQICMILSGKLLRRAIELRERGYSASVAEADEPTTVEICGGCGYPTLGSQLCAFCQALAAGPDRPAA